MTFPSGGSQDEVIRFLIELEAKAAIQSLRSLNKELGNVYVEGVKKADVANLAFAKRVAEMSKQQQRSWRAVLAELVKVDSQLAKMQSRTTGGQFASGKLGSAFTGIDPKAVESIIQAQIQMGRYKVNQQEVIGSTDKVAKSHRNLATSVDAVRIAMGAIVAMVVFRTIQFIEESMRKAIETAKEYETSLYRLSNVSRILSKEGMNISVEGLRKGIQEVKELLPIFSEADITQQISLIGIMTKELGVTERQIIDIAKAIGVLNIRSGETEDLLTTTNKVLTAMVAPSGRGIASLGLDFGEANIEATAFKNNILKAGESFKDLTDNEKDMIKIAILLESTGAELETIQEFLKTNTGLVAEQGAEWEDTLRTLGQAFLSLQAAAAPFVIWILNGLQDAINLAKSFGVILVGIGSAIGTLIRIYAGFFEDPKRFIDDMQSGKFAEIITNNFKAGLRKGFQSLFTDVLPTDAPEWLKDLQKYASDGSKGFRDLNEDIKSIDELPGLDDLFKDLDKLQDKIDETVREFEEKWEGASISLDAAISFDRTSSEFQELGREVQDYVIDIQRLVEDYAIKRRRIQEDMADKIADANRKHRNKELDDEARFQEQMRQLREKFLFNLEDALQERDARQVLRLQRQYEMDKQALINEHALKQKEADRQHQEDLARIREERDDRLAELAEEERIRLQREAEDFQLKQQRAAEDHAYEMEQLRQQWSERLDEYVAANAAELEANGIAAEKLRELLEKYYGADGIFVGLYDYTYDAMVQRAQQMLAEVNAIVAQAQAVSMMALPTFNPGAVSTAQFTGMNNIGPQAQGGSYLATQPTSAIFGDVPEIATFTPIRKLGMTTSQAMMSGIGGMGGELGIEIILSPDLEARIVKKSQDMTAEVFTKVTRSKG